MCIERLPMGHALGVANLFRGNGFRGNWNALNHSRQKATRPWAKINWGWEILGEVEQTRDEEKQISSRVHSCLTYGDPLAQLTRAKPWATTTTVCK